METGQATSSNTITLTPEGGNYRRAILFHWTVTLIVLIPMVVLVLIAVINPFWFRSSFFTYVENLASKVSRWRDYRKYKIYLGVDPKVWHALKD